MLSWSSDPLFAVVVVAIGLAVGFAFLWRRAEGRAGRRSRARQLRSRRGEDAAESLLASHGFTVVEAQAHARWTLFVDGQPVEVQSRADFVVEARHVRGVR